MSARDTILGAVRAALGSREVDAARVRAEADALLADAAPTRPALYAPDLIEAFMARVVSPKVAASTERIPSMDALPATVARYLAAHALPRAVALQPHPSLHAVSWDGLALKAEAAPDEPVGVAFAEWGIAETGSVVFHSGAHTAILSNFLPLHHLVVVRADTIVAHLEDYVAGAQAGWKRHPRNVNITTGASGTTDIEGTLVRGAHGPRYLHIIVVG